MAESIRRDAGQQVPWAATAWSVMAPWWPLAAPWLTPVPVVIARGRCEARQPSRERTPLTVRESHALLQMEANLGRGGRRGRRRPGGGLRAGLVAVMLVLAAVVATEGFGWAALGLTTLLGAIATVAWTRAPGGGAESAGPRP